VILILASAGLYAGWRAFWFLTDDAYIAFRYVSNSVLGYGYTWNLPPFRPVEGYTSFLWVVLLDVVWRVTGIEPPASANVISLLFAYGTTFLGAAMLLRMNLRSQLRKVRLPLLALVLLGVLTNRTYLAWTSSGLETAMFNFFLTAWVFCCLFGRPGTQGWLTWTALSAVLTALTRPDGLLLVGATLVLGGWTLLGRFKMGRFRPGDLVSFTPFLVTAAHFVWRKLEYGEWLPNTFAAKSVAPWPQSGLRYLLSFVMEYALWFWIALGVVLLFARLRHLSRRSFTRRWAGTDSLVPTHRAVAATVAGTLFLHFAYYTLFIGGDHFEYRVYSHLVPFIFLSTVWLLDAVDATAFRALAYLGLFVLFALPIQWTHWTATRYLDTRQETKYLRVSIASRFPAAIRSYIDLFDKVQNQLIAHQVGTRHQEHKIFCQHQVATLPTRSEGILLSPERYPVVVSGGIGVVGWVLPTTNVLDTHGLTDHVVARNPVDPGHFRVIAHERYPPVGYMECFQPNLRLMGGKLVMAQRDLSAADIVDCESRNWPPSEGDAKDTSKYLVIDSNNAPSVDSYLWSVWPPDPLYLYYVPPDRDATEPNEALANAFTHYAGPGCIVAPPGQPGDRGGYLFAFLAAPGRPNPAELVELFPWAGIVTE
jgi:arabinofuranosyltransferase